MYEIIVDINLIKIIIEVNWAKNLDKSGVLQGLSVAPQLFM